MKVGVGGLLGTEREALEGGHGALLVGLLQIVSHGNLAVLDKLLIQEASLLVELLHTAVGDALDHVLGLALLTSLVGSDFILFLADLLGNVLLAERYRVHGSNLHGYGVAVSRVNSFVEGYHGAEHVLVLVVVARDVVAFDGEVAIEFHLLARDTAAVRNGLGHGAVAHGQSLYVVEGSALVCYGGVEDVLSELDEVGVLGYEVGFALEGDDGTEAILSLAEHSAFRSFAVRALGGYGLTLLADDFYSGFDVAVSFGEGLLAVAQTGAREGTQFFDIV